MADGPYGSGLMMGHATLSRSKQGRTYFDKNNIVIAQEIAGAVLSRTECID